MDGNQNTNLISLTPNATAPLGLLLFAFILDDTQFVLLLWQQIFSA